jgi:small subunit ribosomal protein S1
MNDDTITETEALVTEGPVDESKGEEEKDEAIKDDESFAQIFEQNKTSLTRLEPGQKVKTTVVAVSGDSVFVDLGGKSEGIIALSEFKDENGVLRVKTGDEIDAFFVSVEQGVRRLTTVVKGYSTVHLADLRAAYEAELPVSGKVSGVVKGGFAVMLGKVRCFCPLSQIDFKTTRDAASYLGETMFFKILEFAENGANIILSRKILLQEEREKEMERLRESLQVGQEVSGKVKSIQRFGIFVDIGGTDGLVPMSEIGWGVTENIEESFSVGQELTVKIIALDWEKNRLTLSLKEMQADPWLNIAEEYPADRRVSGTVVRIAPFGAFVNLAPGVDGLIHISKLGAGRRIKHPREVLEVGQMVEAVVVSSDASARRISLSMESENRGETPVLPEVGTLLDGVVERVMTYGVIVRLSDNVKGLIPNSEMGTPRGTNHSRMFPEGTPLQVIVTEADSKRGRITLSRSQVEERVERDELNKYREQVEKEVASTDSLGSFGELLKARLGNLK